jgi:hypothetical protein
MAEYDSLWDIGFQNAAKNAAKNVATQTTTTTSSNDEYIDAFQRAINNAEAANNAAIVTETLQYQDDFTKRDKDTGEYKKVPISAEPRGTTNLIVSPSDTAVKTIKTAPIDTILFDDDLVSNEVMTNLIFEDIGGQELINIARNDIVNGQKVSYNPIKNLSSIQQQYNPNNILGIQDTSDKYFSNFSIKFENRVPETGSGPNGSTVYLDNVTGNLIIETINMENDEQVEVEITVSGILYEADFGEIVS